MEFSMPKSSLSVKINKIREDRESISDDNVAVEEPLEIQICSNTSDLTAAKSVSITMRTPGHDFDLALGFLYTESIIKHMDDIVSINHVGNLDNDAEYSNTVRVELKPTANIDLSKTNNPLRGVFCVKVSLPDATKTIFGIANIGYKPTIGGQKLNLEVHLLDFDKDIYKSYIKIEFLSYLRKEKKFNGLDALKRQINQDIEAAKKYFSTVDRP